MFLKLLNLFFIVACAFGVTEETVASFTAVKVSSCVHVSHGFSSTCRALAHFEFVCVYGYPGSFAIPCEPGPAWLSAEKGWGSMGSHGQFGERCHLTADLQSLQQRPAAPRHAACASLLRPPARTLRPHAPTSTVSGRFRFSAASADVQLAFVSCILSLGLVYELCAFFRVFCKITE